jgi:hypothetical protein
VRGRVAGTRSRRGNAAERLLASSLGVAQWLVTAASAGCRGMNSGLSLMGEAIMGGGHRLHLDSVSRNADGGAFDMGRESRGVHM